MKKKELVSYTQDVLKVVEKYTGGRYSKDEMQIYILVRMNQHLNKSKLRRMWEA